MFNVPPIRDAARNSPIRRREDVVEVEPTKPYPRIEPSAHGDDQPRRPPAVEERLRRRRSRGRSRESAFPDSGEERGDDKPGRIDEYA